MKVLLVTDAVGGVWVYSVELARALKPLGVDPSLVVMGPSPDAGQREEAAGIEIIDTGLPLDWLETSPGDLHHAGDTIARIASRERADIVQTSSAALLANTSFEQPCIAVQHSCVASWWTAVRGTPLPHHFAWRRDLVEAGLNRASAIIAPSTAFAAETARIYDLQTPVLTVYNGRWINVPLGIPRGEFVFTAGRLWDEGKNVATLDRAAGKIAVPFQAAGPVQGPNGAVAVLENIDPLGPLGASRIAGLLAARPVFASAALYEPFGLSVLEAAQAGCALVLSDIPTHRELWGSSAIFVPALDDSAFAQTIQKLFDDPQERRRRGELARSAARGFTPDKMARGMAAIYARVTEGQPVEMAGAA
jgi:glycosyltransferase involved in cell wall biosynthesis